MFIKQIDYLLAKSVIKDSVLVLKTIYKYFALFLNKNELVCIIAISLQKNRCYIHSMYTKPQYRNNGYATILFNKIVNSINKDCYASATEYSKNIFANNGFTLIAINTLKGKLIYKFKKERIKNGNCK